MNLKSDINAAEHPKTDAAARRKVLGRLLLLFFSLAAVYAIAFTGNKYLSPPGTKTASLPTEIRLPSNETAGSESIPVFSSDMAAAAGRVPSLYADTFYSDTSLSSSPTAVAALPVLFSSSDRQSPSIAIPEEPHSAAIDTLPCAASETFFSPDPSSVPESCLFSTVISVSVDDTLPPDSSASRPPASSDAKASAAAPEAASSVTAYASETGPVFPTETYPETSSGERSLTSTAADPETTSETTSAPAATEPPATTESPVPPSEYESSSAPEATGHEHSWIPVTEQIWHEPVTHTVYHEAEGHYETVIRIRDAWEETLYESHSFCSVCGLDLTEALRAGEIPEYGIHILEVHGGLGGWYSEDLPAGTVIHESEAYEEWIWVLDQEAWEETVTDREGWAEEIVIGYDCLCGAVMDPDGNIYEP